MVYKYLPINSGTESQKVKKGSFISLQTCTSAKTESHVDSTLSASQEKEWGTKLNLRGENPLLLFPH